MKSPAFLLLPASILLSGTLISSVSAQGFPNVPRTPGELLAGPVAPEMGRAAIVAWHGDRIGRSREQDTMIAIVSLGADRPLSLRPRDGGASIKVAAGHGDLVVMGGSCQRTWDHAILKTSAVVGPRISVQFRVSGVR